MIIGTVTCKAFLPILYWIGFINLLVVGALFCYVIYSQRKLAKDNAIIASMIKRIMGDLPN